MLIVTVKGNLIILIMHITVHNYIDAQVQCHTSIGQLQYISAYWQDFQIFMILNVPW